MSWLRTYSESTKICRRDIVALEGNYIETVARVLVSDLRRKLHDEAGWSYVDIYDRKSLTVDILITEDPVEFFLKNKIVVIVETRALQLRNPYPLPTFNLFNRRA